MSKIAEVLKNHKKMFVPFITAGDPDLETTKKLILAMEEAGATIIELGIPFSDPMAEGPVIQEADIRALNAGTTDKFYARCAEAGVDGTIVPDVPYEERGELETACEKYGVDRITMIAPTSEDRIQQIAKDAKGYVYIVSSLGVTGVRSEITTDIGTIYKNSDGAIVGSAIVKMIAEYGKDCVEPVKEYVKKMADAVKRQ